ncbi:MAG TPA: hypothetical protein DD001_10945 [Microcoleaceae bacterium UBA10368]|nr:hypothetical protein [Microcoleaceae cyanobacterium UBA11344]HBK97789.1 hypothetical protein [Microcoleaceae cyanobacterium UBA10368]HCV30803.1 hypothetical protein [Microcoleaceae cyanobacterium UBA9251]
MAFGTKITKCWVYFLDAPAQIKSACIGIMFFRSPVESNLAFGFREKAKQPPTWELLSCCPGT